ncbi:MAG: extracellular solute-binding protein, partial [Anaerolineae bacterium]
MLRRLLLALMLVAVVALVACGQRATPEPTQAPEAEEPTEAPTEAPEVEAPAVEELNILWAQWDPADYLQVIGNMYEEETGVKVNIVQEPWGTFYDRAFTEFAAGGDAFDGIVGDSQWL